MKIYFLNYYPVSQCLELRIPLETGSNVGNRATLLRDLSTLTNNGVTIDESSAAIVQISTNNDLSIQQIIFQSKDSFITAGISETQWETLYKRIVKQDTPLALLKLHFPDDVPTTPVADNVYTTLFNKAYARDYALLSGYHREVMTLFKEGNKREIQQLSLALADLWSAHCVDKSLRTLAYWARRNNCEAVLDYFYELGIKALAKNIPSAFPAIHLAILLGKSTTDIAKLVSAGADLEARYQGNYTVLHVAAYEGRLDVVDYLLPRLPTTSINVTARGATALCLALKNNHVPIVKRLTDKEGLHMLKHEGHKILGTALIQNHQEAVKIFLQSKRAPELAEKIIFLLQLLVDVYNSKWFSARFGLFHRSMPTRIVTLREKLLGFCWNDEPAKIEKLFNEVGNTLNGFMLTFIANREEREFYALKRKEYKEHTGSSVANDVTERNGLISHSRSLNYKSA